MRFGVKAQKRVIFLPFAKLIVHFFNHSKQDVAVTSHINERIRRIAERSVVSCMPTCCAKRGNFQPDVLVCFLLCCKCMNATAQAILLDACGSVMSAFS